MRTKLLILLPLKGAALPILTNELVRLSALFISGMTSSPELFPIRTKLLARF